MSKSLMGLLKPKDKLSKTNLSVFALVIAVVGAIVLLVTHAAPNPNLPGDLNGDNTVNATDLSILLTNYGTSNAAADINGDGQVNVLDLSILLGNFGKTYSGGGYTNISLPTISGTTAVGSVLTATNGTWNPTPTSYSYAWQICDTTGSNCTRSSTSVSTSNTYTLQSGDAGHTVRIQVAPGGNFTYSKDSAPTAVVTTSSGGGGGTGTVSFDGRAKNMTDIQMHEVCPTCTYNVGPIIAPDGTKHYYYTNQSPTKLWDCTCFMNNDISLSSDSRYGNAYKVAVPTGDGNPWNVINNYPNGYPDGAGQISHLRYTAPDYGKWEYYGMAVKIPSWNGISDLYFNDLASLGYETIQGDQVAFRVKQNSNNVLYWAISQNAGQLTQTSTGWYAGSNAYEQLFMPVTYNQWEDFVIAVNWTADNTGGVEVYARNPAQTSTFTKVFSKLNVPTYAIGSTNYSSWTVSKLQSSGTQVLDKIGLYFKEYGGESETVYESGLTTSSDLATAEATLP